MSCQSYHVSRREFLHAAGTLGVASLLGMPVRELMAGNTTGTAEHVILLWMSGGMSHIDTLDPKPGRKVGGEFQPIKTTASGVEISEILPTLASQMKHAALVRSINGVEGDHGRARYNVMTGYRMAPQLVHPGMGSIISSQRHQIGDLPSFVAVGGRAMSSGYLGQKCEAYFIGTPGMPDPYVQLPEGINEVRAKRRLEVLDQMNNGFSKRHPDPYLDATEDSYTAAMNFMKSPALKAFKLEEESTDVRERYGISMFGRGCLLARRLVEQGVRFVQVSLGGFDTHDNNFAALQQRAAVLDPAIGSLIDDLNSTGMLSKTMVVLLSEFGRTPRINDDNGRDHHPRVFSTMMAGGGIKPGTVVGSSDKDGFEPKDRPVKVADIHATVCRALGVDPNHEVMTPLKRPMKLVDGGTAVTELL